MHETQDLNSPLIPVPSHVLSQVPIFLLGPFALRGAVAIREQLFLFFFFIIIIFCRWTGYFINVNNDKLPAQRQNDHIMTVIIQWQCGG